MVVLSQIMVMQVDEGLDGLLHGAHLDKRHLAVLPAEHKRHGVWVGMDRHRWSKEGVDRQGWALDSLEELEPFDDAAVAREEVLQVLLRHRGSVGAIERRGRAMSQEPYWRWGAVQNKGSTKALTGC